MTIPTISTLPVAPARTDAPATFVTRADAFLAAMVTMQGELNTSIGAMNTDIAGVNDNVTAAQAAQTGAELAETNAEAAQAAAEAASSATLWVSGTSYTAGDVVYSPINYLSYRANTSTSGTTDPSLSSDWTALVDAAPKTQAVASGALANGDLVAVNADGTVSVIGETTVPASAGTPEVFESGLSQYISATYDSNSNKVVIAYMDAANSNYGTTVVGTVTGTNLSFGTAVVFNTALTPYISCVFDSSSNKVVISYQDNGNSNKGTAVVGTVSGTSISFGTAVLFSNNTSNFMSATFDSASNKVVIAYSNGTNSNYGTAVVGTVSGTGISFGTEVVFESASASDISATFDSNSNKVVIAYKDGGNSNYGTAVVGTVSGTSISFGSAVVFESATTTQILVTFDSSSNKIVIAYKDDGNASKGTAIVGTVSGTSISFGTAVLFNNAGSNYIAATFDSNSNKIVIAYQDNGNSNYGTAIEGTVSGTSISFGTPVIFESATVYDTSCTFDSNLNKVVIAYRDSGNSNYGTGVVFTTEETTSNLTAENYIGVSDAAYTDGATASIQVTGAVDDAQSGLTAGEAYYVQLDGTLATTPDNPSVFAGTALSATELLIGKSDATSPSVSVTASGSLANGDLVVVNADGTVSVIGNTVVNEPSAETPEVFSTSYVNNPYAVTYDSANNKIVISFRDGLNSSYGTTIVGTVSGASISFGTPVVFASSDSIAISSVYDSTNGKIVNSYRNFNNSSAGTSIVGTVSGTSISFGTAVVFDGAGVYGTATVFDSANNKIVIAYYAAGSGAAIVGTVSGTSISFGTSAVFNSSNSDYISAAFDDNLNKVVIAYKDTGNSNYGTAVVGTVSGTGISFGTEVVFSNSVTDYTATTYDSANEKTVIAYQDVGNSGNATAIVGTVSGTSISFGTAVTFRSANCLYFKSAYDSTSNKIVIAYANLSNSEYGNVIVGTVSGTSISFSNSIVFESAATTNLGLAYDSTNDKTVIAYRDNGNSNYGTTVIVSTQTTTQNLTAENYIGVSNGAYSDAATANVQITGSVNNAQSGLTAGQAYYAQLDGTLATTPDTTSVFAGTALSATELLIGKSEPIESVSGTLAVDFVATGTLASGVTVALKADGTVEAIALVAASAGTPVVYSATTIVYASTIYDSNAQKVVIAYQDSGNSNYGTAIVGTVSGTSISFGTAVIFESSALTVSISATYDSTAQKVVIAYKDTGNSNYGTAIVGTVSGTSISFGTAVVFESAGADIVSAVFDSGSNKVVIAYQDEGNSNYGTAIVGTVSGTSISFGTAAVFTSEAIFKCHSVYDASANKTVIVHRLDSAVTEAIVATVSGTSISFGTSASWSAAQYFDDFSIAYDSTNQKVVIAYRDGSGKAVVATVSGTSISFGSPVEFAATSGSIYTSLSYDASNQKLLFSYTDPQNSNYGTAISGTVSGTSITFDEAVVFESAFSDFFTSAYDSDSQKIIIAYRDGGNSDYGTAVVFQTSSTNSANFIGITNQTIADTATGAVIVKGGVSTKVTGVTANTDYYVQADGTLSATVSTVPAGRALSTTSMLLKGL